MTFNDNHNYILQLLIISQFKLGNFNVARSLRIPLRMKFIHEQFNSFFHRPNVVKSVSIRVAFPAVRSRKIKVFRWQSQRAGQRIGSKPKHSRRSMIDGPPSVKRVFVSYSNIAVHPVDRDYLWLLTKIWPVPVNSPGIRSSLSFVAVEQGWVMYSSSVSDIWRSWYFLECVFALTIIMSALASLLDVTA